MNPARSFASAFPSGVWTSFWIYLIIPFAGMLSAAEFYLFVEKRRVNNRHSKIKRIKRNELPEPLEFLL
jgi:hypothetical protein